VNVFWAARYLLCAAVPIPIGSDSAAAWRGGVRQGSRTTLTGTRDGVEIRVIVETRTNGFPAQSMVG
jgi:hypothetical protein